MQYKFMFLSYASRSGSTLLARQLSKYSNQIAVLPEFKLLRMMLLRGEPDIQKLDQKELYNLFTMDRQLLGLGFSDDILHSIAQTVCGTGIQNIMAKIVEQYLNQHDREAQIVIIKDGKLVLFHQQLDILFSDPAFIYIYRDGRAVVNSMLKTISPYSSQSMGRGDAIYCAKYWRTNIDSFNYMKNVKTQIVDVCYEELCLNTEERAREILTTLGLVYNTEGESHATFEVTKQEESIHTLVNQPPVIERLEAWKHELPTWQGVAIETFASQQLEQMGYRPWFRPQTNRLKTFVYLARAALIHARSTIAIFIRRCIRYAGNWQQLKYQLQFGYLFYIKGKESSIQGER